jgi:hypothetical protein
MKDWPRLFWRSFTQIKQDVRWLREHEEGRLLAAREKVEESMAAFERIGCAKR